MAKEFLKDSYLFGANSVFIEELYEQYLHDKNSVDESWKVYFDSISGNLAEKKPSWVKNSKKIIVGPEKIAEKDNLKKLPLAVSIEIEGTLKAINLIEAYRNKGHLIAEIDPLGLEVKKTEQQIGLNIENFGFTENDLSQEIKLNGYIAGISKISLYDLLKHLKSLYSNHISYEFKYLSDQEQVKWIESKIEQEKFSLTKNDKKQLLNDIIEVETFEKFLDTKFPGTKRFSVEGGENSVISLNEIIKNSAKLGVTEVVVGMAHRGRLNVLTKIMGKSYCSMISEFQGNLAHPSEMDIAGDVKYHLGSSNDLELDDKKVHVTLTANPSHLEAVNPVVAGRVRAKQDMMGDFERKKVMGVLIHGDAAFIGQGVVAECLAYSDLDAYTTGGVVHIVVNNQVGFTTNPTCARKSRYPTEFAKIIEAPIFHVNGDDAEAVAFVSKLASEFRQNFGKDVVIDVTCFRLHGHNETDEPVFTQPKMYKAINTHKTASEVYLDELISKGDLTQEEYNSMKESFKEFLNKELEKSKTYKPNKADWLDGDWKGLTSLKMSNAKEEKTGVKEKLLKQIGEVISKKPESFNLNSKIARQLEAKKKMIDSGENIDWATAEALAFGSLLLEDFNIRMTGQDVRRGTFSHRHAVFTDQENENIYIPLNNIAEKQAKLEIHNSNLSEYAVLGFEYGYSLVDPKSLVLWEAQFGDFVNGAQIIIDQFISSAETKWLRMSGLVLLLPHGYEGQGPEHSSARPERFLQLCAEDNMQVLNCSTPASYFHALRRQLCRNYRKPLVIMTPKSLLRHKLAVSNIKEMTENTSFKKIIGETYNIDNNDKIRKVIICSGKVYYDLIEEREKRSVKDIAIIRMEQYYPFPHNELKEELKKYKNADVIWCQEEHRNMGAWNFVNEKIELVLSELDVKSKRPKYVGRKESASPAAGYKKIHDKEQVEFINITFS